MKLGSLVEPNCRFLGMRIGREVIIDPEVIFNEGVETTVVRREARLVAVRIMSKVTLKTCMIGSISFAINTV